jgi:hypothetical protein
VIYLVGATSGPKWESLMAPHAWAGIIVGPSSWRTPWRPFWACDNDAYANRAVSSWWDGGGGEAAWFTMLDKIGRDEPPLFAVLPDVVYDWPATLERAKLYRQCLSDRGIPAALALQDGCDGEDQWYEVDKLNVQAVFIGGSTKWKWRMAPRLRDRFCHYHLHIGRVNGYRRTLYAKQIGADSVDGSGCVRHSDAWWPSIVAAMEGGVWRNQPLLPEFAR